jgi:hypothetical protein
LPGTVGFTVKARDKSKSDSLSFAAAAHQLSESEIVDPLREKVDTHPGLLNRDRIYLSGGIVWAMVTILHPEMCEDPFVRISPEDIKEFQRRLENADSIPVPDLAAIREERVRNIAAEEVQRLKGGTFNKENLQAGTEILSGFTKALELEKSKSLYFLREGKTAWIVAYVQRNAAGQAH